MSGVFIMHIALGGCLTPEPVSYGITEDTGGHISYVLSVAHAQGRLSDVNRIEVVTRQFDDPSLPAAIRQECARGLTRIDGKLSIRRFATASSGYLSKEALRREVPILAQSVVDYVAGLSRRPDVVHAHFADAAIVGLRLRDLFGIPLIYTPHSLCADKSQQDRHAGDPTLTRRFADERRALGRADAIVVSSRDEAERQIGLYPGAALARVHQIRPGADLTPGDPGLARPLIARFAHPDRPLILSIARPVAKKNLAGLAAAYAASALLQDRANLLILAGQRTGPAWGCGEQRDQLRLMSDSLANLPLKAALPATHSRDQVRAVYAYAAGVGGIFVNPARVEPFGLTTLEAAAAGLPCVVPARGGAAEVVATLGHGISVDTQNPADLTDAMIAMLQPGRNAQAAQAARHAAPSLGWDRYAAAMQRMIAGLSAAAIPAVPAQPRASAGRVRLLVSDIDGTLTGDRDATGRFAALLRADPGLRFAVATGRSVSEAWRVIEEWSLPSPEALITSAGSEVYRRTGARGLTLDKGHARALMSGWEPEGIAEVLARLPGLLPQAQIEQRRWKLGYVGPPSMAASIRALLLRHGLAATVIHSHGSLIDVMPARSDKRAAVTWLAQVWDIDATRVVVAGDSGNDLAMLTGPWKAIAVGDDPDLAALSNGPRLYRARAAHAAGVIEGLAHFATVKQTVAA